MKIQIISHNKEENNGVIVYSKISSPRSIDEFDVNVIDLTDQSIWYNKAKNTHTIDCVRDFLCISQMVSNSHNSQIIYVFPQDIDYYWNFHYEGTKGKYTIDRMKDRIDDIRNILITNIMPDIGLPKMFYENTRTIVDNEEYEAAFYFQDTEMAMTLSVMSNKATSIQLNDRIIVTTLSITKSIDALLHYIHTIIPTRVVSQIPDWVMELDFLDDASHKESICRNRTIIERANEEIYNSERKLEDNNRYKSILCTNGKELVDVVFEILEKILDYDLSTFKDVKKEDFCIKKTNYTLIGEIKGVSSNVRSEHISQVDVHYQGYMDKLNDEHRTESVHQILIINPLKNKPIVEREPIHETQICIAKRNGCLIIETKTLLLIFEKHLQGMLTTEQCEKIFLENIGLFEENMIEEYLLDD